jgi:hypothetical protein
MPPHSTSRRSILILSRSRPRLSKLSLFPHVSPPKACMHISCLPHVPHAQPIPFDVTWLAIAVS